MAKILKIFASNGIQIVILHPIFSHLLPLGSFSSIIGVRIYGNSTARSEDSCHLNILRIHQFDKVFHNLIHAIFVEISMIAETEKIKLQAFALHHLHVRNITDTNLSKIRLSRDRAEAGEFRTIEPHPVVILLMFVFESLKHFWCIVLLVFCFFPRANNPSCSLSLIVNKIFNYFLISFDSGTPPILAFSVCRQGNVRIHRQESHYSK